MKETHHPAKSTTIVLQENSMDIILLMEIKSSTKPQPNPHWMHSN
jgi:hypothetical protein